MKKIVILLLSVAAVACGGESSNKKESFQYKRVKTIEQKAEPTAAKTPVDLNNKGIGPIDDLVFDTLLMMPLLQMVRQFLNKNARLATKQWAN